MPHSRPRRGTRPWLLSGVLLLLTFASTTTLGALWVLPTEIALENDLLQLLTPALFALVWSDPALLALGLSFSLPLLTILLAHELGHYLACRHYGLRTTPPYFLPAPFAIGTLGAFIRIRSPIADKRVLFDVAVAGPIAGFVALVPFLWLGVAWSQPVHFAELLAAAQPGQLVPVLGTSLAVQGAGGLLHGPLAAGWGLELHPFAVAAWVGLLATSLNLLPLGQLDGGHLLYAVAGRLQRLLALPLWFLLLVVGILYWPGWVLWAAIALILGLRHPPVANEKLPLDPGRRLLALLALAILVVSFMPMPLGIVQVGG